MPGKSEGGIEAASNPGGYTPKGCPGPEDTPGAVLNVPGAVPGYTGVAPGGALIPDGKGVPYRPGEGATEPGAVDGMIEGTDDRPLGAVE